MNRNTVLYSFNGLINLEIKNKIISDFKHIAKEEIELVDKQKKCVYILQEAINNIFNYYTDNNLLDTYTVNVACKFQEDNKNIKLEFSSSILLKDVNHLESKINNLNCIEQSELKQAFNMQINQPITDKKGAGLGLITMALKSNNKLNYKFTAINNTVSNFTLTIITQ